MGSDGNVEIRYFLSTHILFELSNDSLLSCPNLEHVVTAVEMLLHLKVVDADVDSVARGNRDGPNTLDAGRIGTRVVGTRDLAGSGRQLTTAACSGTNNIKLSFIGQDT